MSEEAYRTVQGHGEAAFEIRGSAFIGRVDRADTIEAAEAFVDAVREEYDDATHNVPAYRVRAEPLREYESDADEPSGSAGKPALNVLQQRSLVNVVAVVTRYYGGTDLGVGGLARSYARAVTDAIDDAGVVTERPHDRLRIVVAYDDSGDVRGILESAAVDFEATYEERVTFSVRVPSEDRATLTDRIASATSARASVDLEP